MTSFEDSLFDQEWSHLPDRVSATGSLPLDVYEIALVATNTHLYIVLLQEYLIPGTPMGAAGI